MRKIILSILLAGASFAPAHAFEAISQSWAAVVTAASGTGKTFQTVKLTPGTWQCAAQANVTAATTTTILEGAFETTGVAVATTAPGYTVGVGGGATISGLNVGPAFIEVPASITTGVTPYLVNFKWTGTGGPPNLAGRVQCVKVN